MNANASKRTKNEPWDYGSLQQDEDDETPCLGINQPLARLGVIKKYRIAASNPTICNLGDIWATSRKKWDLSGGHGITLAYGAVGLRSSSKELSGYTPDITDILIRYFSATLPKTTGRSLRLEKDFSQLAATWYVETAKMSSADQMVLHPAYQQIIGMGKEALPLILGELQKTRGHWIWALSMITRDDKGKPGMKFREAVDAWLEWGKAENYI